MPQFHTNTVAVDVWFEEGMVWFDDPSDPDNVVQVTLEDFAMRIAAIKALVEDEVMVRKFVCGRGAARRFIEDAEELIKQAGGQLHVGLPIEVISEVESSRRAVTMSTGFGTSRFDSNFGQTKSGLYVPMS
jgi:hypothetical protein